MTSYSIYYLLFSFIAFVNVVKSTTATDEATTTDIFDTCPIMDPGMIQRRICELQYRVEELYSLLTEASNNQMMASPSDISSNTGLNVQKEKRKNEFIRFGKRKNEFIRFGKRKNEFIRFGRSASGIEEPEEQFVAKRKNEFIRFG